MFDYMLHFNSVGPLPEMTKNEKIAEKQSSSFLVLNSSTTVHQNTNFRQKTISAANDVPYYHSIKTFFFRHLSSITPSEKEQAREINGLFELMKYHFNLIADIERQVAVKRKIVTKFSNLDRKSVNSEHLFYGQNALDQAQKDLEQLIEKERIAQQLATNHSAFGPLPEQIKDLKERFNNLQVKFDILNALVLFEKSVDSIKQFDSFEEIKKNFIIGTQLLCQRHPALKDDPALAHLTDLEKIWNIDDVHGLMASHFPELLPELDRIINWQHIYLKRERKKLKQEFVNVRGLFPQYVRCLTNIRSLTSSIQSDSFYGKAYKWAMTENHLREQLQTFQDEEGRLNKLIEDEQVKLEDSISRSKSIGEEDDNSIPKLYKEISDFKQKNYLKPEEFPSRLKKRSTV